MARNSDTDGGTGDKFSRVVIAVCGIAALIASLLTFVLVYPEQSPGIQLISTP